MEKPTIGITIGDPAGIGPEIALQAACSEEVLAVTKPLLIGSREVLERARAFVDMSGTELHVVDSIDDFEPGPSRVAIWNVGELKREAYQIGKVTKECGQASVDYVLESIRLARDGAIDAVVTGPIHKEAIHAAGWGRFAGHTEIFAGYTDTYDYAMMLTDGKMHIAHVTTHVSLADACRLINRERVLTVIRLAHQAGGQIVSSETPSVVVAGLNPHCGENGLFGREDIESILPAVESARKQGIRVDGPIPADTLFPKLKAGFYDVAVVMYHDQGHIPFKLNGFSYDQEQERWSSVNGVNVTLGLPIIRTSVDHGVAFDIAGTGQASAHSMVDAITVASKLVPLRGNGNF